MLGNTPDRGMQLLVSMVEKFLIRSNKSNRFRVMTEDFRGVLLKSTCLVK